jgi:hypothetical protein
MANPIIIILRFISKPLFVLFSSKNSLATLQFKPETASFSRANWLRKNVAEGSRQKVTLNQIEGNRRKGGCPFGTTVASSLGDCDPVPSTLLAPK